MSQLILDAVDAFSVGALWLEGDSPEKARRPAGALDLHAAVADPDLDGFWKAHESFLRRGGLMRAHEDEQGANGSWICRASFPEGVKIVFTVERQSLLAKRPRKAVVPLADKTGGQLRFVMSFAAGHEMGR